MVLHVCSASMTTPAPLGWRARKGQSTTGKPTAFLGRLRLGFFAAAALPRQLRDRMGKLAADHGSAMQMTTS
jgi:hypothetical protein